MQSSLGLFVLISLSVDVINIGKLRVMVSKFGWKIQQHARTSNKLYAKKCLMMIAKKSTHWFPTK